MEKLREKMYKGVDVITEENDKKRHSAKGSLKEYADPSKWSEEEGAFERAMVEKDLALKTKFKFLK